jgi:hypothetical protein
MNLVHYEFNSCLSSKYLDYKGFLLVNRFSSDVQKPSLHLATWFNGNVMQMGHQLPLKCNGDAAGGGVNYCLFSGCLCWLKPAGMALQILLF